MSIVIKAENISKAYQLGQIGTGTISRDLERWYARLRGKEDPFLRVGESNNQNIKSESEVVWSLKDINFEIEQGDAVGIIGRNGAGKSTLLKILSKVTAPTTGKITGKGRIASLLEVGTGFHPELSGRENIFLNGAILGMRKKEIQRKLEEIVDFAGIERYLDTPVKRYSSGMYVRLAFAVAAYLESEILIVDEVLAVGDAEFQKKCLNKMGDVSKGEGRTILFVSHNMASIQQLCKKGLLIDSGTLMDYSNINETICNYLNFNKESIIKFNSTINNFSLSEKFTINKFGVDKQQYLQFDTIEFQLELKSDNNKYDCVAIVITEVSGNRVSVVDLRTDQLINSPNKSSLLTIKGILKDISAQPGIYYLGLALGSKYCTGDFLNLIGIEIKSQPAISNDILPFPEHTLGNFSIKNNFSINYE